MHDAASPTIQVGDWSADRSTGRLARGGELRILEPKVMDLLFLLASEPNRVFLKDEIHERLWPGVTVGDDSLARCVSKLRRALSDDPGAPRFIETISKRGYRLIAATEPPLRTAGKPNVPSASARPAFSPRPLWAAAAAVLLLVAYGVGRMQAPEPPLSDAAEASRKADEARLRRLSEADRERAAARDR